VPLNPGWAAAVRALAGEGEVGALPDPSAVAGAKALARAIEEARAVCAGLAVPIAARSLPQRPGTMSRLAAALRRHSVILPSAARFGIAVGLASGSSLRAVHADALGDAGDEADDRWPVAAAVEELAFLALALPPHRRPPPVDTGRAFLDHLDALGRALASKGRPPATSPAVPGYPRTSTAAAILTEAAATVSRPQSGSADT
jgi:hypothetical protein